MIVSKNDVCFSLNNVNTNFKGGQLKYNLTFWESLTSDKTILGYIKGIEIPIVLQLNHLSLNRNELKFFQRRKTVS